MKSDATLGGWIFLIAICAAFAYSGFFYQTGKDWYDACWLAKHSKEGPKSADEAALWGQCSYKAQEAVFDDGFILSGNPENAVTPALKLASAACPSNYSDVPLSGLDTLAVDLIERQGGAKFIDRFLPAKYLISRAFEKKWPDCPAVRLREGFPKIVERRGSFDWESPCKPCVDEQKAMDERNGAHGYTLLPDAPTAEPVFPK